MDRVRFVAALAHGKGCRVLPSLAAALLLLCHAAATWGGTVEGFTEPYRSVDVAAAEPGIIAAVDVQEGDLVRRGQVLARLDQQVLQATLQVARQNMECSGQLQAAQAEVALRRRRLAKLQALLASGHARQAEVERAEADLAIALANLQTARETLEIRKLEYQRIKAQLDRRIIRSPIDGVVAAVHKEVGEFVAPNDPNVVTVVQLDKLLATFSVPAADAVRLAPGQTVNVSFPGLPQRAQGTVEFVCPVTDAQSGTVKVKVRIINRDGRYRSGQRCLLQLPGGPRGRPAAGQPRTQAAVAPSRRMRLLPGTAMTPFPRP